MLNLTEDMTLEEKYEAVKKDWLKLSRRISRIADALRMTTDLLHKAGLPNHYDTVNKWLKDDDLHTDKLEKAMRFENINPNAILAEKVSIIRNAFSLTITDEDLDSIMDNASYGATYWCTKFTAKDEYLGKYATDNIILGGVMLVHDYDGSVYEVDREKMIIGISKMIASNEYRIPLETDSDGNLRLNLCQLDAGDSEIMLQFAIFGKQIYA